MTIRAINSRFESVSTGDYETTDQAYRAALRAALTIATDEVADGADSSIVQVVVATAEQPVAMQGAVAVSTARLRTP